MSTNLNLGIRDLEGDFSFGARVDAVVRRRSGLLAGLAGVAGTTVLGNGEVLLVLDLAELAA